MKDAFPCLIGSERLRGRLRDDICGGRFSHAYILDGAQGCGKHTLALQIAAALSCEKKLDDAAPLPCGVCPSCRKILSGNSPDVIYISRGENATLGVDAIRLMHSDVMIAPHEAATKIYVIEEAHLLTVPAQNAFLLTLEEPPAYVGFLLLCETTAPILETVRSRAPTLRLETVASDRIGAHLRQTDPAANALFLQSPEEFAELLIASNGSIGTAKRLLDPKERKPMLDRRRVAKEFVQLCVDHRSSSAVIKFFKSLEQKRNELIDQLNTVLLCLRDLIVCKQSETTSLCFFPNREEAFDYSYRFSAPELFRLYGCVEEAVGRLVSNANVHLTLTTLATHTGLLS